MCEVSHGRPDAVRLLVVHKVADDAILDATPPGDGRGEDKRREMRQVRRLRQKWYIGKMFRKKDLERRCVAAVASIRGGTSEEENGQWPDGWILDGTDQRIPVEVVSAFPERDSFAWARAYVKAAAEASRIYEQTGTAVSWRVHNGRGVVDDGRTELPVMARPLDLVVGVFSAVSAKAEKYGPGEALEAVLVVHHVQWPLPLDGRDLKRIGEHAAQIRAPFREIWIVNEYGDPAQRVPFNGPRSPAALNDRWLYQSIRGKSV